MTLKHYGLAALCLLAGTTPLKANMTKKAVALAAGSGLSMVLMSLVQHKYSRLAHERYPLMQRRAVISTLLSREKQPEMTEPLKAELAAIQSRLEALHVKRGDYNLTRTILGIIGLFAAGGALYEYTKAPEEPTNTPPKKS